MIIRLFMWAFMFKAAPRQFHRVAAKHHGAQCVFAPAAVTASWSRGPKRLLCCCDTVSASWHPAKSRGMLMMPLPPPWYLAANVPHY
ncbi:hypothetical protein WJX73_010098 [Symbiochloris irregularis]|uniref:Secreted protein n=1 Tax=Symbiochloris irregularis TaxID=706552 RepID=A0AAW1P7T6_9CHLO